MNLMQRSLPLWVALSLVGASLFGIAFVYSDSQEDFAFTKAFYKQIFFKPPNVQIPSVSLIQESFEARYVEAKVTVINTGETAVNGLATIALFDSQAHRIASGVSNSTILEPGSKYTFTVPIIWLEGAQLFEVAQAQASFTVREHGGAADG